MRFTAKQTTRSMCVIVLLLFVCCFSSFYGMQYFLTPGSLEEDGRAFSLHYPAAENQISRAEIEETAEKYNLSVENYSTNEAANLVISYRHKDFTEDDSQYVELYEEKGKTAVFVSEKDFAAMSGKALDVKPGTYKTVVVQDFSDSLFDYPDGVDRITNPNTGRTRKVKYDGNVEFTPLKTMSEPFAYVLDDSDYRDAVRGLSQEYKEKMVFFDVDDVENSYHFAKNLTAQYINRATDLSNRAGYWDLWEQKKADAAGESYGYDYDIGMTEDNNMLLGDWRYAPQFSIVTTQDSMQLISVYVMLCLYICIISLAAISVMTYVRSISTAADNKDLFDSLDKLGANRAYKQDVLKKQLAKIFRYPAVIGCGIGFLFSLTMDFVNDGRIYGVEWTALGALLIIITAVCIVMALVYRYALKKAEQIVGI